ncbi:MAG: hypothetical protein SNI70_11280 [Rikenellaceae bacterium]
MKIQPFIDAYVEHSQRYSKLIEESCSTNEGRGKSIDMPAPSYTKDVVIPILEELKAVMPKQFKVRIPNLAEYCPVGGYYRIRVGSSTIGGFTTPDGEDYSIYFVFLWYGSACNEPIRITNISQLRDLITIELLAEA